jgi:hypothetical protein
MQTCQLKAACHLMLFFACSFSPIESSLSPYAATPYVAGCCKKKTARKAWLQGNRAYCCLPFWSRDLPHAHVVHRPANDSTTVQAWEKIQTTRRTSVKMKFQRRFMVPVSRRQQVPDWEHMWRHKSVWVATTAGWAVTTGDTKSSLYIYL